MTITPAEVPEPHIAFRIIGRDLIYQKRARRGRKKIDGKVAPDTMHDRHASHVRRHGLMGVRTGSHGFDAMFQKLRRYFEISDRNFPDIKQRLKVLAEKWERNHPGESFFPQQKPLTA